MKINPISFYQNNYIYKTTPSFKSVPVETITHYNIGMMPEGIIGKVKVFKKNGQEAFLNVDKFADDYGNEMYMLKDKIGNIIGEMDIRIIKPMSFNGITFSNGPSHVLVEFLCNHSNPNTEYYTEGLEEYKCIGTRLLQIAQRRSDEALCNGEIQLYSKNSSKEFYKKLGFVQELDWNNKPTNEMHLPPEAKEPFSRLKGGL